MKNVLPVLILLSASAVLSQEVTLPLETYEELRIRSRPEPDPDPEPPLAVAFEEAVLEVDVGPSSARISQELALDLYGGGWLSVSLPANGSLIEADFGALEGRLDGAELQVRGHGRHRVRLLSVVPVSRDDSATRPTWRLELTAPDAAVVRGVLRFDEAIEEVEAGASAIVGAPAADGRRKWIAEPGGDVAFTLRGAATVPERTRLPLAFDAVSAAVLEVSRSRHRIDARLAVRVLQGELDVLRVELPVGFEVVDVSGAIAGWDVAGGRLAVTPAKAVTGIFAVGVELAGPAAESFPSPALRVDGAADLLLAGKVMVSGDGLLNLLDAGAGRQPDRRREERLPSSFRDAPGLALVTPREGPAPRWQVTWSESTEVLAAQVDRLLVDAVAGVGGRAAYQVWAEVRSSGAAHLSIALPGAELVAGRRDGAAFVPGRSGGGWVVPLAATSEKQVIHLALLVPLALPARDGLVELPIPALSVPVARVEVRVHLPSGRRYELVDAARKGRAGPPPGATTLGAVPLVARQLSSVDLTAEVREAELFAKPAGFATVEAGWSALSPSPAPLGIRIDATSKRKEWF